jgi:hypothetical protein
LRHKIYFSFFTKFAKSSVSADMRRRKNTLCNTRTQPRRLNLGRFQQSVEGGPRDGSGGAVTAAMCAAAIGCKAWASGEGCVNVVLIAGGGALIEAHKGQSSVWLDAAVSSSPCTTSFMLPVLVQTRSMPCGLMMGDAMATPTDSANHTSTRRVIWMAWRSDCMALILSTRHATLGLGKRLTYLNRFGGFGNFNKLIDTHQESVVETGAR